MIPEPKDKETASLLEHMREVNTKIFEEMATVVKNFNGFLEGDMIFDPTEKCYIPLNSEGG